MRFLVVAMENLSAMSTPLFYERDEDFIIYIHNKAGCDYYTMPLSQRDELDGVFRTYSHIITAHSRMAEMYSPFKNIVCENGFKLIIRCPVEGVVVLAGVSMHDEGGSDIEQLERRVNTCIAVLFFLYGPTFDHKLQKRDTQEFEWLRISLLINKWAELVDKEHSFLVEALEELAFDSQDTSKMLEDRYRIIFSEAFAMLSSRKLGPQYSHIIHGMLIAENTLLSFRSSNDDKGLLPGDKLLLLLFALAHFPSRLTIEDLYSVMVEPKGGTVSEDEIEEEAPGRTDSDPLEEYYSGAENVDEAELEPSTDTERYDESVSPIDIEGTQKRTCLFTIESLENILDESVSEETSSTVKGGKEESLGRSFTSEPRRELAMSPTDSSSASESPLTMSLSPSLIAEAKERRTVPSPLTSNSHRPHDKGGTFPRSRAANRSFNLPRGTKHRMKPFQTGAIAKSRSLDDTRLQQLNENPRNISKHLGIDTKPARVNNSSPIQEPSNRERFHSVLSEDEVLHSVMPSPSTNSPQPSHLSSAESNESFFSAIVRPKSVANNPLDPEDLLEKLNTHLQKEQNPAHIHFKKDVYMHQRVFLSTSGHDHVPHCLYCINVVPGICLILAAEICDPSISQRFVEVIQCLSYLLQPSRNTTVNMIQDVTTLLRAVSNFFSDKAKDAAERAASAEKLWRDQTVRPLKKCIQQISPNSSSPEVLPEELDRNIRRILKSMKALFAYQWMAPKDLTPSNIPERKSGATEYLEKLAKNIKFKHLRSFTGVMITKAKRNLPMSVFHKQFPGLVHFIYVNRTKHILKAPSLHVAKNDKSGMVDVLTDLKVRLWKLVPWFYKQLSNGYTYMSVTDGDFIFTFEFELFDNINYGQLGPSPHIFNPRRETIGNLRGQFYRHMGRKLGRVCLELLTVHLAIVPEEMIARQRDELFHDSLYERDQPN